MKPGRHARQEATFITTISSNGESGRITLHKDLLTIAGLSIGDRVIVKAGRESGTLQIYVFR